MSMGPSVPDTPKILLVVEGKGAEPVSLKALSKKFGMEVEIVSVEANLYMLYDEMKALGFDCDVKDVLRNMSLTTAQKNLLEEKYAYTYLVFDCDAHHDQPPPSGTQPMTLAERFAHNMARLIEMAEHFTNETDPAKGRLYVNWPMLESFRDCDDFFEDAYRDRTIAVAQLGNYKTIVGQRKHASRHVTGYSKKDFRDLIRMNVRKLNALHGCGWTEPDYTGYMDCARGAAIARKQEDLGNTKGVIAVLNTVLFVPVDYFGQQFFESVTGNTTQGSLSPSSGLASHQPSVARRV